MLSDKNIEEAFARLPLEWSLVGGTQLERAYSFDNFVSALKFVNKVGDVAEKLQHHPDILLSYGKVDLIVTTHSEGGLTQKDFDFVEEVEKISQN